MSTVNTKRTVLSPEKTKNLKDMVEQDRLDKQETNQFYTLPAGQQKDDQIKRVEKVLKESEPDSLSRHERDQMEKRARDLKAWLQKNMNTKGQVRLRPNDGTVQSYEFRRAVSDMVKHEMSAEFQQRAQEYKNIMNQLGRSEEANLEAIRPD